MANPQKIKNSEELRKRITASKGLFVAKHSGLNSKAITDLRKKMRENNSEMFVAKNTTVRFAVEDTEYKAVLPLLTNESSFFLAKQDVALTAKILDAFCQENPQLEIKGGVFDSRLFSAAEVLQIAKLPSREVLLAKMLGSMNAPVTGFVNSLAGILRKLLYALNAVKEQKEKSN